MSGEEIIANFTESKEDKTYTLKDPCVLIPSQEGKLMFVKWVPYANMKAGVTISASHTVFVLDPLAELEDHFTSVITNNLFVPSKRVETPNLVLSS